MKIETFLEQSPLFTVNWATRKFESHVTRLLADKNLNFLEALILVSILFEEPKRVSPSQLAMVVSSLEASGLLARRIDPDDARGYQLFLKPQGRKTAMQVIRTFDRMQTTFEQTVGAAQLQTAIDVIRRVERVCSHMEAKAPNSHLSTSSLQPSSKPARLTR
jgi:DNA-binding MarR family transcriptional regulator